MSDLRQLPLFQNAPDTTGDLNQQTPLNDTVALFQAYLTQDGKSEHTVKSFTSDLHLVAEYFGDDAPLGYFTTRRLDEFLNWMEFKRGVPCSRKTYARRVTTLKVYFKWLHASGALPLDPAAAIMQRSGPAPLSEVLSPDQCARAIEHAQTMRRKSQQDRRPELLFRLLLETGIKKSEATRLQVDDVNLDNPDAPILLVRHKNARGVFKERRIDISVECLVVLERYLDQYNPQPKIFTCTPRNLEYILEDIGKGAGFEGRVSFEMMRWTSAVRDYRAGRDPELIREKLGLSRVSWQETFAKIKKLAEVQLQSESAV